MEIIANTLMERLFSRYGDFPEHYLGMPIPEKLGVVLENGIKTEGQHYLLQHGQTVPVAVLAGSQPSGTRTPSVYEEFQNLFRVEDFMNSEEADNETLCLHSGLVFLYHITHKARYDQNITEMEFMLQFVPGNEFFEGSTRITCYKIREGEKTNYQSFYPHPEADKLKATLILRI